MTPEETRSKNCLCPTCGKPLTLRVMHRVSELADREEPKRPSGAAPYQNLVPLDEVLSEIHGVGPASKAVRSSFEALLARLGSEPAGKPRSPFRQLTLFDAG
jgi:PHP family Zn ribbon phosphoesterase